jgi:uncharacterized protein YxjI
VQTRVPGFRNRIIGAITLADILAQLSNAMGERISLRIDEGTPFSVGHVHLMEDNVIFHALEENDLHLGNNIKYGEQVIYFVDGKAFHLREHLGFQDMQGNELAAIQERVMRIKDTYRIYRKANVIAAVKKVLISPLDQRFEVHVAGGMNMEAQGTIFDHDYEVHEGRRKVAEVSKMWFPVADTYGVDIVSGVDEILVLAITVVIDMMLDQER